MKTSRGPQVLTKRILKESSGSEINKRNRKSFRGLSYIVAAAKKVTRILQFVLYRQRKFESGNASIDDSNSISQISKRSADSTESSTTISRKSSRSSVYSSSSKSRQPTTISFSFEEIYKATENFSPANKIGEGGSGTVYKGKLKDGSIVAVKRARKNKHDKYLLLEFRNEILTLSKIEHLNLVKLLGFLEHEDERIIVVEHVSNGTLREHLDGKRGKGLELAERLDIAIDVAHALTYLHTYSDPPIIHRDVKASNILITEKLRAKVTDFGFARMSEENFGATHISTQVKGTTGYLDPDYLRSSQLTEKSDVYSFGVLLVEMMTGRHPVDPNKPMKERVTIRWAIQNLKSGDAVLVMDPSLRRSPVSNMAVEKVLKLAHVCLAPTRQSRPTMKKCAEILWKIRKSFRERAFASSSPAPSHHSSNYPIRDAKRSRQSSFGMDEGDSHNFLSV